MASMKKNKRQSLWKRDLTNGCGQQESSRPVLPITYSFKVLQAIQNRVGAKLVPEVMENVTTPDQYELLEMNRISGFVDRARGTGRPTKKERRDLDEFIVPAFLGDFDFEDDDDDEIMNGYEDDTL